MKATLGYAIVGVFALYAFFARRVNLRDARAHGEVDLEQRFAELLNLVILVAGVGLLVAAFVSLIRR